MVRPPSRSPSTPNIGAASVPRNCSEAKAVSHMTEPVLTSTYQPRMSVSISNAHDVSRSEANWNRKLRTRRAARLNEGDFTTCATLPAHRATGQIRRRGATVRPNRIKQMWREGRYVTLGWLSVSHGFTAEVMARQGFDALCVDMQHGTTSMSEVWPM